MDGHKEDVFAAARQFAPNGLDAAPLTNDRWRSTNAIAAFRHAPEWGGVLAFNEFGLGTVVLKPAPSSGSKEVLMICSKGRRSTTSVSTIYATPLHPGT